MQRHRHRQQPPPQQQQHHQQEHTLQQPPPIHWGLDRLTDAILVVDPLKNQNHTGVHVVTPGNLSHQSSINSAASSRSTHSRTSTFSVPESPRIATPATTTTITTTTTTSTLPVTFYQVPHTYDDPPATSTSTPRRPRHTSTTTSTTPHPPSCPQPSHFVVAAFGMTSAYSHILFDQPNTEDRYEAPWKIDYVTNNLTTLHFTGHVSQYRDRLRALGYRCGITTFLVCVAMNNFNTIFMFLDAIRSCMDHNDKSWWSRVVLVFDQIHIQEEYSRQERDRVLREIPRIQAHYGMEDSPDFCFITAAPDIVRHQKKGAAYRLQCQRVLYQIMNEHQSHSGCWRPSASDDDDDDDEYDHFNPSIIHISALQTSRR